MKILIDKFLFWEEKKLTEFASLDGIDVEDQLKAVIFKFIFRGFERNFLLKVEMILDGFFFIFCMRHLRVSSVKTCNIEN
jgi:hypothetical protein